MELYANNLEELFHRRRKAEVTILLLDRLIAYANESALKGAHALNSGEINILKAMEETGIVKLLDLPHNIPLVKVGSLTDVKNIIDKMLEKDDILASLTAELKLG